MPPITLEAIEAKQTELSQLIAKLLQRLYLGWSTEKALTTPVKSRGVHK